MTLSRRGEFTTAIDFKALMALERQKLAKSATDSPCLHMIPRRKLELQHYAVAGPPAGVYYVPGFLSEEEASKLELAIDESPDGAWNRVGKRRLQHLGGTPCSGRMRPKSLPAYAAAIMTALVQAGVFCASSPPNHILLNEYRRGQGITAHKDGPLYEPLVAVVSLGLDAVMQFWSSSDSKVADEPVSSLVLEPRSLLVFTGEAYTKYWHGIRDLSASAGDRRLSLTVRRVVSVRDADDDDIPETAERREEELRVERNFLHSVSDAREV